MKRLLLLCTLVGCARPAPVLPDAPQWQNAILASGVEVQWGYSGSDFVETSPWKEVTGAELETLRKVFATPVAAGQLKCLVHIDGRLRAGGTKIKVCLGCGQLFADQNEYHFGGKDELRAVMTKVLGAQPPEPNTFPGY